MARDMDQRRAPVNTIMNIPAPQDVRMFLSSSYMLMAAEGLAGWVTSNAFRQ
jgi:hypothetical protein